MTVAITSVRIVGGTAARIAEAASAARRVFPEAHITRMAQLQEVLAQQFVAGGEVLVLAQPTARDLALAAAAADPRGQPRWAIVAADGDAAAETGAVVHIATADWKEPTLVQALPQAVRLQALLAQAAQMRGDMRTVTRRLGHDVRSPLNAILSATEAMVDPGDAIQSTRGQLAKSVSDSVDEVMKLFERICFILKATAAPPASQPVIMEEIVRGALERFENRLSKAGIKVVRPQTWPIIEGVPTWLDVIWTNLIANSFAHAGPKGVIELGWERVGTGHRFWIRDNGPPVASSDAKPLFFPFERLGEINAPRGLGLPIVRRLVELHGGQCGHEPAAEGSGTFYFTIPAIPGEME